MQKTTKKRAAAYELTWSVSTGDDAGGEDAFKLEYQVEGIEELYIADRLWVHNDQNRRAPDPFGVYRFVRDGSLRLVFAQAPHSPLVMPQVCFEPLFSRIQAGETRRQEISIKLPVDEYSALERDITEPAEVEEVSRVIFVLDYRLRSDMDADPRPPPRETAEDVGYVVWNSKPIISSMDGLEIPVKRRTGDMARFALPEDKRK